MKKYLLQFFLLAIIVLNVGGDGVHVSRGHMIYYAGMSDIDRGIFSIVHRIGNGMCNLYYPKWTEEITVNDRTFKVKKFTPTQLTLEKMN